MTYLKQFEFSFGGYPEFYLDSVSATTTLFSAQYG